MKQDHLETLLQTIQAHIERERNNRGLNDFNDLANGSLVDIDATPKSGIYTYFIPAHQPQIDEYGNIEQPIQKP